MEYSPRYRHFPTTEQRESLDWTRDIVRQVYNHALHEFNHLPEDEGTLRQRVWQVRDQLPTLKQQWTDLKRVYSTVLQKAVERIRTNINNLGKLKASGYDVGSLNWKSPREFRSFTSTEYDAVFVEDLNVKSMLESDGNSRNKAEVGWRDFITLLKHHGRKHGCHVIEVDPEGRRKSVRPVAWKRRNHSGCGSIRARRVGSSWTEIGMPR